MYGTGCMETEKLYVVIHQEVLNIRDKIVDFGLSV